MIIETSLKAGDTVTIKTGAGEEILARFVEETDKILKVKKPMTIMATQQGIGLGPFAFTLNPEADVILNKNAILVIAKTDSEMASQYVQSTTGIQMV